MPVTPVVIATSAGLPDETQPVSQAEAPAEIVPGIKDVQAGRTRPAREVLDQLATKFGLSQPA